MKKIDLNSQLVWYEVLFLIWVLMARYIIG
jgi:hypothetical protein